MEPDLNLSNVEKMSLGFSMGKNHSLYYTIIINYFPRLRRAVHLHKIQLKPCVVVYFVYVGMWRLSKSKSACSIIEANII